MAKKKKPKLNPGDVVYWKTGRNGEEISELQIVLSEDQYKKSYLKFAPDTVQAEEHLRYLKEYTNGDIIYLRSYIPERGFDCGWMHATDCYLATKAMIILFGKVNGKKKKSKV